MAFRYSIGEALDQIAKVLPFAAIPFFLEPPMAKQKFWIIYKNVYDTWIRNPRKIEFLVLTVRM